MTSKMSAAGNSDAQLVEGSLTGDRDAFARIVKRYQSLVCSITYNATGSLSLSADLAQETFLAAWKQLPELREPSKLRSWLCAITRFLVGKELRRRGREPIHAAEPMDAIHDSPSLEPSPSAQAVSREQEAILWGALERIPEVYREPLILFYREQQSVERVAEELELSEDAVKQRLSRGRKLLHEEVMAFVEGTLSRSAPGQAFSDAVLAVLPAAPAATAGLGMASKGTAAAKSGLLGLLSAPMIAVVSGLAGGIVANWLVVRAAPTARERQVEKSAFIAFWIFVLGWCVAGQAALRALRQHWEWSDRTFYGVMAGFWWFSAVVFATWTIVMFWRRLAMRRQTDATRLSLGARIAMVTGVYLGFFSWLIALAWMAHDQVSAGIIAGTTVALGVWHFFLLRGRTGRAAMWATLGRIALAFGIILAILNVRLDVWMAAIRGTDLAEIHRLLPAWVVPSLTLALLIWVVVVFAVMKPRRSGSILSMLLAGCLLVFACPTPGQCQAPEAAIPDQFRPLYRELDETLRQARQTYPFQKGKSCPLVAPSLFLAGSGYGPAASDSQRWKDLLATLDAFKSMRMNAVSVMVAAPDLTLGDPGPLIGFYQRLAREIHSRDMQLYVEHFVNPPFSPHALKNLQDNPQGRKDFLKMMESEVTLIYREIKPDYLSLVTEPETTMVRWTHLSFSADELANWIGETTKHLKSMGASPNTLLGAGAGTWEAEDFVLKFAQQTNLDYVDIHLYALRLNAEDHVAKLATLVRKVREARPDMSVTIGETWLYKHGAEEPKGMFNTEAFSRDSFSFWSPLDEQFLNLLMGIAQKENISVVAPYFSQYFFACYTFGDAESSKLLPWPGNIPATWDKALESIHNHRLSPTGKAMSAMLDDRGK